MKYCELYRSDLHDALSVMDLSPMYHKSILITGGSGLILSVLVDILCTANHEKNADIKIYLAARSEKEITDRFTAFNQDSNLHYVHYDALLPVAFDFNADYVIHGASNAHPSAYSKEPVETLLANVTGIKELLDYAKRVNSSRVLYISSSEVYGKKDTHEPYVENDYGFVDILNPRACYPSGKRASETLCSAYYAEYGVETVIVRPGHIYGPTMVASDSRATAQFARDVLSDRDIIMKSDGSQLRSYCYAVDCATAILTVLLKGTAGEAYNISNRNSITSIRLVAEEMAVQTGKRVVFENPTDAEKNSYNMMDNSSLDSKKLEGLGWHAQYSLSKGVAHMLSILMEQEK